MAVPSADVAVPSPYALPSSLHDPDPGNGFAGNFQLAARRRPGYSFRLAAWRLCHVGRWECCYIGGLRFQDRLAIAPLAAVVPAFGARTGPLSVRLSVGVFALIPVALCIDSGSPPMALPPGPAALVSCAASEREPSLPFRQAIHGGAGVGSIQQGSRNLHRRLCHPCRDLPMRPVMSPSISNVQVWVSVSALAWVPTQSTATPRLAITIGLMTIASRTATVPTRLARSASTLRSRRTSACGRPHASETHRNWPASRNERRSIGPVETS